MEAILYTSLEDAVIRLAAGNGVLLVDLDSYQLLVEALSIKYDLEKEKVIRKKKFTIGYLSIEIELEPANTYRRSVFIIDVDALITTPIMKNKLELEKETSQSIQALLKTIGVSRTVSEAQQESFTVLDEERAKLIYLIKTVNDIIEKNDTEVHTDNTTYIIGLITRGEADTYLLRQYKTLLLYPVPKNPEKQVMLLRDLVKTHPRIGVLYAVDNTPRYTIRYTAERKGELSKGIDNLGLAEYMILYILLKKLSKTYLYASAVKLIHKILRSSKVLAKKISSINTGLGRGKIPLPVLKYLYEYASLEYSVPEIIRIKGLTRENYNNVIRLYYDFYLSNIRKILGNLQVWGQDNRLTKEYWQQLTS